MVVELPIYITLVFLLSLLLTYFFFLRGVSNRRNVFIIISIWTLFQGILGYLEFYKNIAEVPQKIGVTMLPPLVFISILFSSKKGKDWISTLSIEKLTLVHVVRIPVELVLYWLFLYKMLPELMTFKGYNFDIIAGITAPIIYYFGFVKSVFNRYVIIIWNMICLGLLVTIVVLAILSAPLPIQQFAFEQPNIAIFYFPFVWLPSVIVPLVLFSHLVVLKRYLR